MRPWRSFGRNAFAALLCLSLAIWSVAPAIAHASTLVDTLQEHAQMIADHGHSHGLEEDIAWAAHGHAHDVVDHDHSPAFAVVGDALQVAPRFRDGRRLAAALGDPRRIFRIDRPPRA